MNTNNNNNDAIVELLLKYLQNNTIDINKSIVTIPSPKNSSYKKKNVSELESIYKSFKPEPIKGINF